MRRIYIFFVLFFFTLLAHGQFHEEFDEATPAFKEQGLPGWHSFPGDGDVVFTQKIHNGMVTLRVNAVHDKHNIWYALSQTNVADQIDLEELKRSDRELRIEARVRPSHAPRRCNLYLLSPETGEDHLREFDLPTRDWHVISMTTSGWQVGNSENLLGQISMMDWGVGEVFTLDVDYMKVEVVDPEKSPEDSPLQVEYHPGITNTSAFNYSSISTHATVLDRAFPDQHFGEWMVFDTRGNNKSTYHRRYQNHPFGLGFW